MLDIEREIKYVMNEIKTQSFDMSCGEIIRSIEEEALIIQSEFQRSFRWTVEQQSRFIESLLLELPIPPIITFKNYEGRLEVIDGIQRIFSLVHFMLDDLDKELDAPKPINEPLILEGCDLITKLNGKSFRDLPLSLQLNFKRYFIRTIILKRESNPRIKHDMFKRFNTGGSIFVPQEIRNYHARLLGENGVRFYEFLRNCALKESFQECTETLSQSFKDQRGDEELVLRFYALKNARDEFKQSVRDWLDNYMESVCKGDAKFNYEQEEKEFDICFNYIAKTLGMDAFVRFRDNKPIGGLAPVYYEAVTMGIYHSFEHIENIPRNLVKSKIIEAIQSDRFKENVGPAANTRNKLNGRIEVVKETLLELQK